MAQLFTNNASTRLVAAITNVALTMQVSAGTGLLFPILTGGDFFLATLSKVVSGIETATEIVRVTARATDVFTIVRAQEGTTAIAFAEGDVVSLRATAGVLTDTETHKSNMANPHAVTKAQVGLGNADNVSDANKPVSTAQQTALNLKQDISGKDAAGGYAGLTLFALNLKNATNTFTNFLTNATTAVRTWTFPDKSGTVAMTSDITGVNSGTNTGDQTITLTGGVTGSGTGSFAATVVTNANLTGHVTSLGNATVLGSFTSEQLAVALTDETGTGAAVFANSPTLVTPALGTPASGVATNLTGTAAGLTAGNVTTNANLTGEVTSVGNASTVTNAAVINKVLTGYVSGAGTVAATDTILQAVNKLNGNNALKQDVLVSGTNVKTVGGVSILGAGNITAGTPGYAYDNRATLRTLSPANGDAAIVKDLGLFIWESASTEPDDDESAFATASGIWLLQAAAWDLIDSWQSVDEQEQNNDDEDEPLRFATSFATKILTGSATCAITSVASVSSVSFTGTVTGAAVGDRVIATPPAQLGSDATQTGLLGYHAWVSAANTVTVMLTNASAQAATTNTLIRAAWPVTVIKT